MLRKLPTGGKIGILAPAFPPDAAKLHNGVEYLQNLRYEVKLTDSPTSIDGYFAGSDEMRLNDLHNLFADPEIDMIICARGGWGTLRMLDKIDYELIKNNPKAFVGYSDITTLHLAFWQKCGIPSLSGPMAAVEMGTGILPFTEKHFWDQVFNTGPFYNYYFKDDDSEIWQQGRAEGTLLGGCLSMVSHQLGTPYTPDYADSILFLEDVGEEPFKIDCYLAHLKQAGILDKIKGLILGVFLDCLDDNESRAHITVKDVLHEYFADSPYPVIYNFPYGHTMKKVTMPVGARVSIDTKQKLLKMGNVFGSK